jgi:hypothetical protein
MFTGITIAVGEVFVLNFAAVKIADAASFRISNDSDYSRTASHITDHRDMPSPKFVGPDLGYFRTTSPRISRALSPA